MLVNNIKIFLMDIFVIEAFSLRTLIYTNVRFLKFSSFVFFILLLNSCIEEFNPKLGSPVELVVIDGSIVKGDSLQQVVVSRSTAINNTVFNPIFGCDVWVVDEVNREFYFEEKDEGVYQAVIPDEYLAFNSRFKLRVTTPDNNEYESEYEQILESSPIDSVYYGVEPYQSSSEQYDVGLQFYADLKAPDANTKNYRWNLVETYEYHSKYYINGFWDTKLDTLIEYIPQIDSLFYCWTTSSINELYSSSTENLLLNEKKKIPLSYVME